jgi:hypothetical protein
MSMLPAIIKLSLLINYETSCDILYDLNIIKYYFKNKVQLFVVFILPWLKMYKGGNSPQRKTLLIQICNLN